MMVLLSFMPSTTIKAQFNTVGRLYNQQVHKTKNPQETNTSLVDNLMLKDSLNHASSHLNMVESCRDNVGPSSQTSIFEYGFSIKEYSDKLRVWNALLPCYT